jgi:TPR repeat protein
MKRSIKSLLAALVVSLSLAAPVLAGPLEDGDAAYNRGDYATALRLWRPLAEQGFANAQNNLGLMYANGQGVARDNREAVKWYRLAAEQGFAQAQYNLGFMYAKGRGVARDYARAHMWANLSASSFSASEVKQRDQAIKIRDALVKWMSPAQIAEAQRLAREWKPKK